MKMSVKPPRWTEEVRLISKYGYESDIPALMCTSYKSLYPIKAYDGYCKGFMETIFEDIEIETIMFIKHLPSYNEDIQRGIFDATMASDKAIDNFIADRNKVIIRDWRRTLLAKANKKIPGSFGYWITKAHSEGATYYEVIEAIFDIAKYKIYYIYTDLKSYLLYKIYYKIYCKRGS